jgi:hypothetical protein
MQDRSVWIGFEPREMDAYFVATRSLLDTSGIIVNGLHLSDARRRGWYRRQTEYWNNALYDVISEHPMATEFAISRFLTPMYAGGGLALFTDCDVMFRRNVHDLFDLVDPRHAVSVVMHDHCPDSTSKMDGQVQSRYSRKNWSSVMVFNCDHAANRALTLDLINSAPGRDLHRFCWLDDNDIGEIGPEWNYLVGHTVLPAETQPAIVHWTDGAPCMPGYRQAEYADEFFKVLKRWH